MQKVKAGGLCLLLAVCILSCTGCGCAKNDKKEPSYPQDPSQGSESCSEPSDSDESPYAPVHKEEAPPILPIGAGTYTAEGIYVPPQEINGQPVIESGSYPAKEEDQKNETNNDNQPTAPSVSDVQEDIYQKAIHRMDAYTAQISFHHYADGWHDEYQYEISYDPAVTLYTAMDKASGKTITYTSEAPADGDREKDSAFSAFCRYCSFIPPLSLTQYQFDKTPEGTIVSARLNGNDYRETLCMASSLFQGFETYSEEVLAIGDLFYQAKIDSQGRLSFTSYQYTFNHKKENMEITVIIDTYYE